MALLAIYSRSTYTVDIVKKMNKTGAKTIPIDELHAICRDCAMSNGARCPYDEYVCTVWFDICGICNLEKACCSIRDWSWPGKHWNWVD